MCSEWPLKLIFLSLLTNRIFEVQASTFSPKKLLKLHDLAIRHDTRCEKYSNSRETNKQPQLQKQAQNMPNFILMIYYHQYYLLSITYYQ